MKVRDSKLRAWDICECGDYRRDHAPEGHLWCECIAFRPCWRTVHVKEDGKP